MRAPRPLLVLSSLVLLSTVLTACGRNAREEAPFMGEAFDADDTYSRIYDLPPAQVCSASRLALLGQGYAVNKAGDDAVEAVKNFQPEEDVHTQLSVRVSCVPRGHDRTLLFVSALLDRYNLRKSSSSASLGVGGLGSVSLPIGSRDDSLVRVASSTVQDTGFYRRFFERVGYYVPQPDSGAPRARGDGPVDEDPPPEDLHGNAAEPPARPR
ncbi:DUF2242 domain-containing protein [Luteimonas sp. BDR2-5]|uniref:DUF2242 domain-containing protein n=1 Tax=Proluteimonas luteida TaxID=2878685 RepID=UPI001E609449|nr:DUF2242 domain-containing protein [Luteimonas sp. BDR2-5]MCD9027395.1 DUF2242 domain-containing protein [Luteimonas sp. BDR2-5]